MGFIFKALNDEEFSQYYGLTDEALKQQGIISYKVESQPGYPCRVSLKEAEVGKRILLLNYQHLNVDSPYRSSHAIFVEDGAVSRDADKNTIPQSISLRQVSIRAFNELGMMIDADCVEGKQIKPCIENMLNNSTTDYLHIHTAKRGCYLARVERI